METDQLKCREFDDFVEWRYKDFYVIGVEGMCDVPLDMWSKVCANQSLDFAPLVREEYIDFLVAFSVRMSLDVAINQNHKDSYTSIVSYGLDEQKSRGLVNELVKRSGLITNIPNSKFVRDMTDQLQGVGVYSYQSCERIAEKTRRPFEKVFAEIYYASFLRKYKGFSEDNASRIAEETFK